MDDKVYDEATKVDAHEGRVVLDGPDGVAVLMTPEAAEETSHRLLEGALDARGQEIAGAEAKKRREGRDPGGGNG
ncbi:MAG: hypothetical protein ACK40O_09575 [Allosphingosinicella sp.]